MNEFLVAWALCMTAGCFVVLAVVVGLEIRDRHPSRAAARPEPTPAPVPRIPAQRQPTSAAVIVEARDLESFEEFLAELILTPHIEEALS